MNLFLANSQRIAMEGQRDGKALKVKTLDGIIAPMVNLVNSRRYSSIFDPYASDSSNSPSPLMKYLCSADPAASVDSPPMLISPVKVEEDVIVMDGIPVPKSSRGGGESRLRFSSTSSNSIAGVRSNSTSSLSAGSGNRGTGTDNSKNYKHRLCRFWESTGICQFGSECQFAHGKEELRPPRSSGKPKFEIFKLSNNSEGLSSSSYGTKYPPITQAKPEEETLPLAPRMAFPAPDTVSSSRWNWSPGDDGIDVKLGDGTKKPTKKEVDAYIEKVLYHSKKKRLPVFEEITPGH